MLIFFFFNDTATTEIYTLSLHDALPIYRVRSDPEEDRLAEREDARVAPDEIHAERQDREGQRSEEHTSELQSQSNLVCRLLLEKKKNRSEWVCRRSSSTPTLTAVDRTWR